MCERGLGQNVVGEPVRELRERVGRARRDHEQVGAREMRVEILAGRPPREGEECLLDDEALRSGRDERHDVMPLLHEQAHELARLVGSDPTGDAHQNPAHAGIVDYFFEVDAYAYPILPSATSSSDMVR